MTTQERVIDERASKRGVTIDSPPVSPGDRYWRVVEVRYYDEQESQGRHHIFVEARDDQGNPLTAVTFKVMWPTGISSGQTNGRSGFDAGNFPMSPSRNDFSVKIVSPGLPSEIVKGIGMGAMTPGGYNSGIHTSTGVVFQWVQMPVPQPGPAPVETHLPSVGTGSGPTPVPAPVADNFQRAIAFVLSMEGGFQNNPADSGNYRPDGTLVGTNWGISAHSYPNLDIRNLSREQAIAIYEYDYWQPSGAVNTDWPACLLLFDTAVLHGVATALKWESQVGTNPYAFAAKRLRVYTKSNNWNVFGAGWTNRVAALLEEMGKQ